MSATRPPLLELRGMVKRFGDFTALNQVDFDLRAGEVHVLFGENGAGKSTMISLLAGAQLPTAGEMRMRGEVVSLPNVRAARKRGISAVFQEFSLVPTLTVAQNLFLGDEPVRGAWLDRKAMQQRARELLDELKYSLDPDIRAGFLTRAEQQMVEIAKAFHTAGTHGGVAGAGLSVLILDEPTASLTDRESEHLFELVERIKAQGTGIIYITHRMQEIARIADRVTVLRDGCNIGTVEAKGTTEAQLIEMMAGRSIAEIYPHIANNPGQTLLTVEKLSSATGVRNASLTVRRGEVVGLAGLVGSGKSELMRAVFGVDAKLSGEVNFKGKNMRSAKPTAWLRAGFCYLPPDRKEEGLVMAFSSQDNIVLPALGGRGFRGFAGFLARRAIRTGARATAKRVGLTQQNLGKTVAQLSGGNQQKVLFGKALIEGRDLYVFDEPTVGVDVGTRSALYGLIRQLCEDGAGVMVISSDLPEVLNLSHRLYVMRRGEIVAELAGADLTESKVLGYFFEREEDAA